MMTREEFKEATRCSESKVNLDLHDAEQRQVIERLRNALKALVEYHDPDSLNDQRTDYTLRREGEEALTNAEKILEETA